MPTINLLSEAFNTRQSAELVEVSYRKLIYWDQQGLVKPSVKPASGRGSRRLYGYADLLALKTVHSLREQGASLQRIRRCVLYLRKHLPDISKPLHFCTLVSDGESIYLIEDEGTLLDTVRRQGQRAMLQLIKIETLDRQLREKVLRLAAPRVEEVTVGEETYQVELTPDREEGGYAAEVAGLPGCITQGDTVKDVLANARDAIRAYLKVHADLSRQGVRVPVIRHGQQRRQRA